MELGLGKLLAFRRNRAVTAADCTAITNAGAVVITGAASGIGRALALRLAGDGVSLALLDVDADALTIATDQCRARGSKVDQHAVDVTDADAMQATAEAVHDSLGRIGTLFNVAGIIHTGDVLDSTTDDTHRVIDVDFWGVVHGTKAYLPYLIASGNGRLVNISSAFGLIAAAGYSAYNAAKFAVRGYTESLRQEMLAAGHPVTVTCVYPGGIQTAIMRSSTWSPSYDGAAIQSTFDQHIGRTSADDAAVKILRGSIAGRARVLVGPDAVVADVLARVTGSGYQRIITSARSAHERRSADKHSPEGEAQ